MTQMEMLLAYQTEDMKADALEQAMRRSPNRQKLEQDRDFILKQQKQHKALEAKLATISDRREIIDEALPRYEKQLKALTDKAQNDPPADLESAQSLIAELEACAANIADYETELKKMIKDETEAVNQQRHIRKTAAATKQEFDALKVVYEKELAQQKKELEAQRAAAAEQAKGIEAELMAHYASIKKRVSPPVAKLISSQCTGCNNRQPSAVLRKIKEGAWVECETCGRLIVQTEA